MQSKYQKYWNIIKDKLDVEEWRCGYADKGNYKMAVFGFRSVDNPDATSLNKGKKEYEWEQKVWKLVKNAK